MLQLIHTRKDVWMSSLENDDYDEILNELPEKPDLTMAILMSIREGLPRGIFYMHWFPYAETLRLGSFGLSEIDPSVFLQYKARYCKEYYLGVELPPDARLTSEMPSHYMLENPNYDKARAACWNDSIDVDEIDEVDYEESIKEFMADYDESELPFTVGLINHRGRDLTPYVKLLEQHTPYIHESNIYAI